MTTIIIIIIIIISIYVFISSLGLDTCVRKPLIITCGVDKSVRIWNYLSKSLELCVIFADAPRSVAFHPSGLYCLIGFPDKLRLCTILMSDIRLIKELPYKNCIECQFSNGGHLFAAVNVGMINVFNFFTCELVGTFRGHSAQIRSVFWSLDDTALVSSSEVGEIYERRHKQTTRSQEYIQKGCKFTSILSTEDSKIYAVGDDSTLKEIIDGSLNKTVDTGTTLTQLVVSAPPHRMMFASTVTGMYVSKYIYISHLPLSLSLSLLLYAYIIMISIIDIHSANSSYNPDNPDVISRCNSLLQIPFDW